MRLAGSRAQRVCGLQSADIGSLLVPRPSRTAKRTVGAEPARAQQPQIPRWGWTPQRV